MVRRYMYKTYREKSYAGGFYVHTTIRADHQRAANKAVRSGLLAYERRHGYRGSYGKIKIGRDLNKELMDDTLAGHRSVGGLLPSVILLTEEKSALAYTKEGYVVQLNWEDISWARRFLDVNSVGRSPKKASDVLATGDIVYLEELEGNRWMLAQVPKVAGAMVSLRPSDGAILALTGGFDFEQSHFNRVEQAERQPGSNIKPFIYSAALEHGFTAASTISGAPIVIEDENLEGVWRPENYNLKFYGPTRLRKALLLSINTVSVRLLRAIGVSNAISHLEAFGFKKDKLPHNLSLALGSGSLTPLELVSGFGVFANGGYQVEPYFISSIKDGEGNIIEQANPLLVCPECPETETRYGELRIGDEDDKTKKTETPKPEAVATTEPAAVQVPVVGSETDTETSDAKPGANGDKPAEPVYVPRFAAHVVRPENIFIMRSMMQDVIRHGTGRRALELKREDIGGKTGTTNDFKDAWFSGFNQDVVATAWVGYDQPDTLGRGEAGSRAALPIWIDYMHVALKGSPQKPFPVPENIVSVFVDPETGRAAHAKMVSTLPTSEAKQEKPVEPGQTATETDENPVADTSDFDDPDENNKSKLTPIEEYFIAGTEPKVEITEQGEQKPVETTNPTESLPGLF